MRFLMITAWLLAAVGCATGYHKEGFSGGLSETAYAPDVWQISFSGNAFTPQQKASDMILLRAAELALDGGYLYITITDSESWSSVSTHTTPTTVTTNSYVQGSASVYGNNIYGNAYGQSKTRVDPGQTYTHNKPRSAAIYVFSSEKSGNYLWLDAGFLYRTLAEKYGVENKYEARTDKDQLINPL